MTAEGVPGFSFQSFYGGADLSPPWKDVGRGGGEFEVHLYFGTRFFFEGGRGKDAT